MSGLVKRSAKVSFIEGAVPGTCNRMKGFSSLSVSKNPKEYSRQYVDEDFETTDVTGYSPTIDFALDQILGDAAQKVIIDIIDAEAIGDAAMVTIVTVDMSSPTGIAVYTLTADTALNAAKTYYTRSGSAGSYVYAAVASPLVASIATYYETAPVGTFAAVQRDYVVVPSSEGDSLDAYTYGGTLKTKGPKVKGTAVTTDAWVTCTFTATV